MMKKNMIAAAALLAMAGAANAQMTIYGLIDMSYGKSLYSDVFLNETKATFHSGGDNGNSEGNSTTRIGFKGTTDLGGGLKANFNLQSQGITSSGSVNDSSGGWFGRQAWFGFSGGFGEVRMGRQDSVPFQVMGDFDFNGQSNGVSAGAYTFVGAWATGRQSRSLQYMTPNMGGLSAQFGYVPKGNGEEGDKNVFSAAVKFAAGPLLLGASMEGKRNSSSKNFSSVAASYDFGPAKVMASYANAGKGLEGGNGKGYVLGVVAPIGGWTVGAHYAKNSDELFKVNSLEVFANKEIFKNTYAYIEAGDWKNKAADGGEGVAINGLKRKGTGYAAGVIFVF